MPLAQEDIDRISAVGYTGFYVELEGVKRLRNIDGLCFFLEDGMCKIYPDRPEGCILYPIIINERWDVVGVDEDCPYADEFEVTDEKVSALLSLLRRIEGENNSK